MKRPLSVTVISWIFILGGIISIHAIYRRFTSSDTGQNVRAFISEHPIYFAFTHFAAILAIICGIFMLFGFNWARRLLFVWFVWATIADTVVSPSHFWNPCMLFVLALCFLFRQAATDYFRGVKQEITKRDERRVASHRAGH
jgi:hypothetical protein